MTCRRAILFFALGACSAEPDAGVATTFATEGTSDASTTSTSSSSTEDTSSEGSSTGGGIFDVAPLADVAMPYHACGKVDFLFVIDGSGSMRDERENLIANFPTFVNGIEDALGEVNDYHVGVVAAHEWFPPNPDDCEYGGALVVRDGAAACGPYAEGHNYMTQADDLGDAFACAASLPGAQSNWTAIELPMWITQQVVGETMQGPGQCNEGFLRDDSLLVIVVITDEADGDPDPETHACDTAMGAEELEYYCPATSPGTPTDWFDAVVAARGGIEGNVVMLSLLLYEGGACPPEAEDGAQSDGRNIVELTNMFTHGVVGGLCEPSYAPYFAQAVDVVVQACDDYVPPQG